MAMGRRIVWRREMVHGRACTEVRRSKVGLGRSKTRHGRTCGEVRSSKMGLRSGKMLWRREMWRWRGHVRDRRCASEVGSRGGDGDARTSDSKRCRQCN
jgi:hypothetical protein